MYAGALDERIGAVVPVCSVGNYQAYLKTACCVCEVLPGALRFTEEGDVLGLVAPRALLVINASKDGIQFSPAEAEKSIDRAKRIFNLHGVRDNVKHLIFESSHDYSKPMREAMYGWMNKHLRNVGDGRPVDEPTIKLETPEDLACYPDPSDRPDTFLFPPSFAGREAKALVAKVDKLVPRHAEEWESSATHMRGDLSRILGDFPKPPRLVAKLGVTTKAENIELTPVRLTGESDIPLPMLTFTRIGQPPPNAPACVLLHLDGKREAAKHPVAAALAKKGWQVAAPDLRTIGDTKPAGDAVRTTPDHNSAEHGVWIGRPLLGQWAFDVFCIIEWLSQQPGIDRQRIAVVGIGQAGVVALTAGALFPDRISSVATISSPVTLVTSKAYPDGTRMGLLAPRLFMVGDLPHLAAMAAPRRLIVANATDLYGKTLIERAAREAFAFPLKVYAANRAGERITVASDVRPDDVAGRL
jgi:pimeloyl-ACP methyl ester carboxylesterase